MDKCIVCGFPALPKHPIIKIAFGYAHWRCALHAGQMLMDPANANLTTTQVREKAARVERERMVAEGGTDERDNADML